MKINIDENIELSNIFKTRTKNIKTIKGKSVLIEKKIAIVAGQWHSSIINKLLLGSLDTINEAGIPENQVEIIYVPGAYEIPLALKKIACSNEYSAAVTLGVVIKGDTPHFDFVAGECSKGISSISLENDFPVGFGVLTVNTIEQALERAKEGEENKGREATLAALEMADLLGKI